MAEATAICQLAATALKQHDLHPYYHRIGLPGIQGVEAALTILQECYGFSYPGGLFLAAVDIMLEKEPVLRAVKQQLQQCAGSPQTAAGSTGGSAAGQQQLPQPASSLRSFGSPASSRHYPAPLLSPRRSGAEAHQQQQQQWRKPSATGAEHDAQPGATALLQKQSSGGSAPQRGWLAAGITAAESPVAWPAHHPSSSSTAAGSTGGATNRFSTRGIAASPVVAGNAAATATVAGSPAVNPSSSSNGALPNSAAGDVSSPGVASSPVVLSTAARLARQTRQQEMQQEYEDRLQRQQQQLQALLFDAPSEVLTASLVGSTRHVDLSGANSPQQMQAQQELQLELSRSSCSSHSRSRPKPPVWPLQPESEQQQQLLPQPQKAQEQQQLQETLQFARQPVAFTQQLGSPVSSWQQWQQQQQLQQQAPSPLAVPQPQHKQPPLSPPLLPPHTASPAATPPPLSAQRQQQVSDEASPAALQQPAQSSSLLQEQQHAVPAHTAPVQPESEQQQESTIMHQPQQQRRSPQQQQEQLQDLQYLAGILQPVLYDDAAASEVLSEWLSGSDVAVMDSETGSDAAYPHQATYIGHVQPVRVAGGPAASPAAVPQVLQFTPAAARQEGHAGRSGAAPATYVAAGAGATTPSAAAQLQQQWTQEAAAAVEPSQTGHRQTTPVGRHTPDGAAAAAAAAAAASTGGSPGTYTAAVNASPGSSITIKRPGTADQEDVQSLVLDIDLARVLDSSGTIVLHVRRDESGTLTAAAALAPPGSATAAGSGRGSDRSVAATASTAPTTEPLKTVSPVTQSRLRTLQQELPFGSISVEGSIGAACSSTQRTGSWARGQQRQQEEEDDGQRPVHRVLRYSAEGRVSIGSVNSTGAPWNAETAEDVRAEDVQPQPQFQSGLQLDSCTSVQSGGDSQEQEGQQEEEQLQVQLSYIPRRHQLGDMTWVMADIQPTGQGVTASRHQGGGSETDQQADTAAPPAQAPHSKQQELEQQPQSSSGGFGRGEPAAAAEAAAAAAADTEDVCGESAIARATGDSGFAPGLSRQSSVGRGSDLEQLQQGLLADAQHQQQQQDLLDEARRLQQQQQQQVKQGRKAPSQRVSLEPPGTPVAENARLPSPDRSRALQAALGGPAALTQPAQPQPPSAPWLTAAGGELGTRGPSSDCGRSTEVATPAPEYPSAAEAVTLPPGNPAAAEAATPAPAYPAAAAAEAATPAAVPAVQAEASEESRSQAASPLPPELMHTETPAGFKFWAGSRAAAGAGFRYPAAQDTLDSLSTLAQHIGLAAATAGLAGPAAAERPQGAAAVQGLTPALTAGSSQQLQYRQQQQQQHGFGPAAAHQTLGSSHTQFQHPLQHGLLGKSLELLGLDEAQLLRQLGLNQVSFDLLAGTQTRSLEQQMLQALSDRSGASAGAAGELPLGAQQLAAGAMELLQRSLALAAVQLRLSGDPQLQQQHAALMQAEQELGATQQLGSSSAAGAANTTAYQSLELLPRQLLASLQAILPDPVGTSAGQGAPQGTAYPPALLLTSLQQQAQQQQLADAGGSGSQQQGQLQQQQGAHESLTTWLSGGGAGSSAGLQSSVNLMLRELEQQQPLSAGLPALTSLVSHQHMRQGNGDSSTGGTAALTAGSTEQPTEQNTPASASRGSAAKDDPAGAAMARSVQEDTPEAAAAVSPSAETALAETGGRAAGVSKDSVLTPTRLAAAVHDTDMSEMCATASPVMQWHAALNEGDPATDDASTVQLSQPQQQQQQLEHLLAQHQQVEATQQAAAEQSYESWSNRVQQLLRLQNPDAAAAAGAPAVPSTNSLEVSPSPSAWDYGVCAEDAEVTAGAAFAGRQEAAHCRTSVMTNPLYWAEEASTGDIGTGAAASTAGDAPADAGAVEAGSTSALVEQNGSSDGAAGDAVAASSASSAQQQDTSPARSSELQLQGDSLRTPREAGEGDPVSTAQPRGSTLGTDCMHTGGLSSLDADIICTAASQAVAAEAGTVAAAANMAASAAEGAAAASIAASVDGFREPLTSRGMDTASSDRSRATSPEAMRQEAASTSCGAMKSSWGLGVADSYEAISACDDGGGDAAVHNSAAGGDGALTCTEESLSTKLVPVEDQDTARPASSNSSSRGHAEGGAQQQQQEEAEKDTGYSQQQQQPPRQLRSPRWQILRWPSRTSKREGAASPRPELLDQQEQQQQQQEHGASVSPLDSPESQQYQPGQQDEQDTLQEVSPEGQQRGRQSPRSPRPPGSSRIQRLMQQLRNKRRLQPAAEAEDAEQQLPAEHEESEYVAEHDADTAAAAAAAEYDDALSGDEDAADAVMWHGLTAAGGETGAQEAHSLRQVESMSDAASGSLLQEQDSTQEYIMQPQRGSSVHSKWAATAGARDLGLALWRGPLVQVSAHSNFEDDAASTPSSAAATPSARDHASDEPSPCLSGINDALAAEAVRFADRAVPRLDAAAALSGPSALDKAVEDTLCAAEEAMRQALERIQRLKQQDLKQQQLEQQLIAGPQGTAEQAADAQHQQHQQQDEEGAGLRLQALHHKQLARSSWDYQPGPHHTQQLVPHEHGEPSSSASPRAALAPHRPVLDAHSASPTSRQRIAALPAEHLALNAAANVLQQPPQHIGAQKEDTGRGPMQSQEQRGKHEQQREQTEQEGSLLPAGAASRPIAFKVPAGVQHSTAQRAHESPSVKWVREVLLESSSFSSYMQAITSGGGVAVHPTSQPGSAGGRGASNAGADCRAENSNSDTAGNLRQKVTNKMSALLAAVQSAGELRNSSGSDVSMGRALEDTCSQQDVGKQPSARDLGGSAGAKVAPQSSGVWQDKIQQAEATQQAAAEQIHESWSNRIQRLLAAADAAADNMAQPDDPMVSPQQDQAQLQSGRQQQQQSSSPSAGHGPAWEVTAPGRAAAGPGKPRAEAGSGCALPASHIAAAAAASVGHAGLRTSSGNGASAHRPKPASAAAAAAAAAAAVTAIVTARHAQVPAAVATAAAAAGTKLAGRILQRAAASEREALEGQAYSHSHERSHAAAAEHHSPAAAAAAAAATVAAERRAGAGPKASLRDKPASAAAAAAAAAAAVTAIITGRQVQHDSVNEPRPAGQRPQVVHNRPEAWLSDGDLQGHQGSRHEQDRAVRHGLSLRQPASSLQQEARAGLSAAAAQAAQPVSDNISDSHGPSRMSSSSRSSSGHESSGGRFEVLRHNMDQEAVHPAHDSLAPPTQRQQQQMVLQEDQWQSSCQAAGGSQDAGLAAAAAALAARQRERLLQLSQRRLLQRQQQKLLQARHSSSGASRRSAAGPPPVSSPRAAAAAAAAVSTVAAVVADMPFDRAGSKSFAEVGGTGSAARAARRCAAAYVPPDDPPPQQQHQQQQQRKRPAGTAVAPMRCGGAASHMLIRQAGGSCLSMFDVPRPQGYTFSSAKTRALADLAAAAAGESAGYTFPTGVTSPRKLGSSAGIRPAAAAAASSAGAAISARNRPPLGGQRPTSKQQQLVLALNAIRSRSASRERPRSEAVPTGSRRAASTGRSRPAIQQQQQPLFAVSPEESGASLPAAAAGGPAVAGLAMRMLQGSVRRVGQDQAPSRAAALSGQQADPASQQVSLAGSLQQQDSAVSKLSHGLSLRHGGVRRAGGPVGASAAVSSSLTTQHSPRQSLQRETDRLRAQQQQQPAQVGALQAARQRNLQGAGCAPAAGGGGGGGSWKKAGRTSSGAVAAVAAIKAVLAGFGTRGWQQQDITSWLSRLRLDLLPDEPSQPLLSNPLRNGLLLAGIAAGVTLQPLPGIHQPVKSLAAARANLLKAASHLSLVCSSFAAAAAAAAAQRDKDEALKGQASASSLTGQGLAVHGSPGFRAGSGGTLPGSPVRGRARSGLTSCSSSSSPLKAFEQQRSHSGSRNGSPNRSGLGQRDSRSGSYGGVLLDVTSSSCQCFTVVAAGPGAQSLAGEPVHLADEASVLCGPASSCGCDCWACQQLDGTVLEHAVLQLLELVMAGDLSCIWGLLYALEQSFPVARTGHRASSPTKAASAAASKATQANTMPSNPAKDHQQQRQQKLQVPSKERQSSSCGVAAGRKGSESVGLKCGGSSSGCIVVQPLQGPSWRSFLLPYNADELQELEQHLLRWLVSLDIFAAADIPDFSSITAELSSGVLLAEVAAAVGAAPVIGVQERPVSAASRASNIYAALEAVQQVPGSHSKLLLQNHAAAVLAGERPALTALLESLWVSDTGQQAGQWLRWAQQPPPAGNRAASRAAVSGGRSAAAAGSGTHRVVQSGRCSAVGGGR